MAALWSSFRLFRLVARISTTPICYRACYQNARYYHITGSLLSGNQVSKTLRCNLYVICVLYIFLVHYQVHGSNCQLFYLQDDCKFSGSDLNLCQSFYCVQSHKRMRREIASLIQPSGIQALKNESKHNRNFSLVQ